LFDTQLLASVFSPPPARSLDEIYEPDLRSAKCPECRQEWHRMALQQLPPTETTAAVTAHPLLHRGTAVATTKKQPACSPPTPTMAMATTATRAAAS
jgi:hypothetical protein